MSTPFADPAIWQHGTFSFVVASASMSIDTRGNRSGQGEAIALTFKLRPSGGNVQHLEESDKATVPYDAKLVAVNGNYENFILPNSIKPGDVGDGNLGGRQCKAIVKSLAQSSLAPILQPILGSSLRLELDFRIRRGSAAS